MGIHIKYEQTNNTWIIGLIESWAVYDEKEASTITEFLRKNYMPYSINYIGTNGLNINVEVNKEETDFKEVNLFVTNLLLFQEKMGKMKNKQPRQQKILEPRTEPKPEIVNTTLLRKPVELVPEEKPLSDLDKAVKSRSNIFRR